MEKMQLTGLNFSEMKDYIMTLGYPAYRSQQIFSWLHGQGCQEIKGMTNLPERMRQKLEELAIIELLKEERIQNASDGTKKFLFALEDNHYIESVLLYHSGRISLCVSTQVGCKFKCPACATGKMGFKRNLTSGEIVSQGILAQNYLGRLTQSPKLKNIVFMGMGEPLDNLANVLRAIEIFNHSQGLNIGSRRITVSTCGLVPQIIELADKNNQIVLAVSLHAANDQLRNKLVPINKKYPLAKLMEACKIYFSTSHRRITFEYAMIEGVNDNITDAQQLIKLLQGFPAHINLIPLNPIVGTAYLPSRTERINSFMDYVTSNSALDISLRQSKGKDILAACGQLHPLGEGER